MHVLKLCALADRFLMTFPLSCWLETYRTDLANANRAANGQQELSTTSAQQGLALAESTGDTPALLQLWLLMAALEGQPKTTSRIAGLHVVNILPYYIQQWRGIQPMSKPACRMPATFSTIRQNHFSYRRHHPPTIRQHRGLLKSQITWMLKPFKGRNFVGRLF